MLFTAIVSLSAAGVFATPTSAAPVSETVTVSDFTVVRQPVGEDNWNVKRAEFIWNPESPLCSQYHREPFSYAAV